MTATTALDLDVLRTERIVAIIRGTSVAHFAATATTLVDEGIRVLEFPLTTPEVLDAVAPLAEDLGSTVHVGVGSVTTLQQAIAAREAGAAFLVSPNVDPAVIAYARSVRLPMLAGAFSPTEVVSAWNAGATAVKLFPASLGGPGYVRELVRGPFPDLPLIPTGGVAPSDVADYLDAGAVAFGLGGSLVGDAADGGDLTELRRRVDRFRAVAQLR
jgi:2-dehydro-3-deoxyphosphogluconate aldolase/(4S)-4-hydroxy-2-oxoglutarate aldolase